ncbi:hypothetical protein HS1_002272 [Candidatus Desulfofervidus auxilii]|uniref:Uncharacterized protein n=1 Tax=Desulfofervidus auxilii TaxID=1621989 RepID=A0A7V1K5F5_DESA2|nr:hypothetical protein [Candidatus Desulfofervidus auxilii]CAD7780784.1 hypothetical protein BLFGPEAP_02633 [Candidatus Methanoperedenaceae archaeon GB50]CAD7781884.1 hypothetical protein DMNBHIDG_02822 [Candidatus Methanoperedenaceae archaeon GB37]AMM42057.1 hypothetical protein HS1_002272 [Candidatus Desulfofervidus auxilii]CAD7782918.1 MAG: hypothetical protein KIIPBIDF_01864 [Candidatus Methanoperedenaceae archaeon GB50]CAD7783498.1 MAG: hypothetical protein KCCBMMGE_01900 [Candidatus Met
MWEQLDPGLIKKIRAKLEEELSKKEIETIQYWLEELNKVYNRHREIITLQNAIKELSNRMQNRIRALKEKI